MCPGGLEFRSAQPPFGMHLLGRRSTKSRVDLPVRVRNTEKVERHVGVAGGHLAELRDPLLQAVGVRRGASHLQTQAWPGGLEALAAEVEAELLSTQPRRLRMLVHAHEEAPGVGVNLLFTRGAEF
eukprot:CAMPEP_0177287420 /NCGR_PEP_ID=MMETSP0367-20130122/74145_1 /TAXON_ID=447022 ORGANISM="Scrippsiella hangoei-like, Strain SHHI-4" /NCGR_SAMPLE_ID=MMETSP0367 /ASSEMBLY_ACC=CAM_ASM_000362 /LENGTH=125 /DNA_ID=CAMNT_0018744729 /DNA_START=156 /DNA_END=534 /DNA_ORIENTATION=-